MQKGFIQLPVLVVLAVLALVGAYYVGTTAGKLPQLNVSLTPPLPPEVPNPSADETANWKTHDYSKFGYSFKLPSTYNISENQSPEPSVIQSININERDASQGPNDFIVTVQTRNIDLVLQESTKDGFTKTGTKTINGKEWISMASPREIQYLIQIGSKTYTFDGRNTILLNQILSTFKFTQ